MLSPSRSLGFVIIDEWMEPNVNDPLLCVVCRFGESLLPFIFILYLANSICGAVPYDQWLITHLDPSWNVKQVKLWILSKCNLVDAPDLPRFRAVSPITFASHPRGASFDASNGDDSDDEGGNESSSVEDGARHSMTNRKLAESWPSHVPRRRSESHIDKAPPAVDLSSRYTILTFSNTHILEDAFVLSHYKIHPHELLEIHPAGSIVRLQREVMVQYIRPYFEAPVKALRKTPSSSKEGFIDRVGAGRSKSAKMAGKARLVSSDPLVYGMFGERSEPKKKKTTKLEWRERWVVIHEGVLSLCNDRSVRPIYLLFIYPTRILTFFEGPKSFPAHSTFLFRRLPWRRTFEKHPRSSSYRPTYRMCQVFRALIRFALSEASGEKPEHFVFFNASTTHDTSPSNAITITTTTVGILQCSYIAVAHFVAFISFSHTCIILFPDP